MRDNYPTWALRAAVVRRPELASRAIVAYRAGGAEALRDLCARELHAPRRPRTRNANASIAAWAWGTVDWDRVGCDLIGRRHCA